MSEKKRAVVLVAPADTPPPYNLRLPRDLNARLRAEATRNNRSLNSEIVFRLRRSFEGWRQL